MKLDFSMLSQPASTTAGRVGTPGTQAFMRVSASSHPGEGAGTNGDHARSADIGAAQIFEPCPQYPACFAPVGTRQRSVYALSPVSPLSRQKFTKNANRGLFDRRASEERAATMQFDGDAAKALTRVVGASESVQVQLLGDLREHFEASDIDRIASEALIETLCADQTRRWATYNNGERITQRQVAALLGKFGIVPGTIRLADGKTLRGYLREKCEDAFARYLPQLEVQHRHNPHAASFVAESASTTNSDASHFANPPRRASSLACGGVTHENPQTGGVVLEEDF